MKGSAWFISFSKALILSSNAKLSKQSGDPSSLQEKEKRTSALPSAQIEQ